MRVVNVAVLRIQGHAVDCPVVAVHADFRVNQHQVLPIHIHAPEHSRPLGLGEEDVAANQVQGQGCVAIGRVARASENGIAGAVQVATDHAQVKIRPVNLAVRQVQADHLGIGEAILVFGEKIRGIGAIEVRADDAADVRAVVTVLRPIDVAVLNVQSDPDRAVQIRGNRSLGGPVERGAINDSKLRTVPCPRFAPENFVPRPGHRHAEIVHNHPGLAGAAEYADLAEAIGACIVERNRAGV